MSRKSVRHAAQQYLSAAQIPGVGTVFASPPKVARSSDAYANLPAGTPSGSVLFVEVMTIREKRLGFGGPTNGTKETRYTLRLQLLFRSRQGKSEDAMDDHDDQVEAILAKLRADRTLGTNGTIIQYGQSPSGISVSTGLPKEGGTGTTHIWTLIDGDCVEIINE
jgi:hypothetical protein